MEKYVYDKDKGFIKKDNYGFEEYFEKNIDANVYKLMAGIYDGEYGMIYAPGKLNHSDLGLVLSQEFGNDYRFLIGALGNEFDFYKYDVMNEEDTEIIKEILLEIKNYYKVTKNDVKIRMHNFEYLEDKEFTSKQIDEIMKILNMLKNVKSRI